MQVADRLRHDLPVVGFKLAKPSFFVSMYRLGPSQFVPYIVTIIGMLITDRLTGVGLGLAVAVVVILRRNDLNSHSFHVELRDEPGSRHGVRIRVAQQVTFLSRGAILQEFCEIPDVLEILHDFKSSAAIVPASASQPSEQWSHG